MSIETAESTDVRFDLFKWDHTIDGSQYTWEKDGYTVEAIHNVLNEELYISVDRPSKSPVELPKIEDFDPDNSEDIRRTVSDALSADTGEW